MKQAGLLATRSSIESLRFGRSSETARRAERMPILTRTAIVCGGPPIGGKEIMALELGEGLRSNGHAVEFVTSHWTNGDFQARLQTLGLPSHQVWFGFISATMRLDSVAMTAHQLCRWPHLLAGYYRFLCRFAPNKTCLFYYVIQHLWSPFFV